MNMELYIAKRFQFAGEQPKNRMSRPAVRIATIGIAVGLAVMIVAASVVVGFKNEVKQQVIGFGSHIQVSAYAGSLSSFDTPPIAPSDSLLFGIISLPNVAHVQKIATKTGIIKTKSDFHGVVLKGVGQDFDWSFFKKNMQTGDVFDSSDPLAGNQVVISQRIADAMRLNVGDYFLAYFVDQSVRVRKFTVYGIYATNFTEYDDLFILTDIRQVQSLNRWESDEISRLEIWLYDFDKVGETADEVYVLTANRPDTNQVFYQSQSIKELLPRIFDWLSLLDMNAWVSLVLMFAGAGVNMIAGLLILILERTNDIGVLKALGATNWTVRKIFLYQSMFLILKGMFWGNIIGVLLILLEYCFHIIPLDPIMYYVNYVPVSLNFAYWILLNVVVAVLSVVILVVPSYLITKISPSKSMKFD